MSKATPLTTKQRERIYAGKLQGMTLQALADEIGCSVYTARKWWRVGREGGWNALHGKAKGPTIKGTLAHFDPQIQQAALLLKKAHPTWGANRVLIELSNKAEFRGLKLPSRSRLQLFFKERCPEHVATQLPKKATAKSKKPPRAQATHEIWQVDTKEGLHLQDGTIASIFSIRDPFAGAIIASQAFSVKSARHWRKLTLSEVQQVLRLAFSQWQTLPDAIQSDNELLFNGSPTDPMPSALTLYLRGLGVKHLLARPGTPTDQAHVERTHRTLAGLAFSQEAPADLTQLQKALDQERQIYNHQFPSRASDCAGRPPLVAHPELLKPRRFYQVEQELALFNIQRVYEYLATFRFERKVSSSGQVSLGRQMYSVGRTNKGLALTICCDANKKQWVFLHKQAAGEEKELARRKIKNLSASSLTGLESLKIANQVPIQLTLPYLIG